MPGGVPSENEASVSRSEIRRSRSMCMHLPSRKRVTIPVFVNQVLCRGLAQCAEPLWAVGRHPDKIACLDRIPVVSEAVNAAAFEHQQAVLHDVDLHQCQPGASIITLSVS